MWNANIQFDVVSLSSHMIMGWTVCNGSKNLIYFVYAKCGFYDRRTLWVDMEGLTLISWWGPPLDGCGGF